MEIRNEELSMELDSEPTRAPHQVVRSTVHTIAVEIDWCSEHKFFFIGYERASY